MHDRPYVLAVMATKFSQKILDMNQKIYFCLEKWEANYKQVSYAQTQYLHDSLQYILF
jgi:uncharacterized pyridoxamine 5'-phosphate oxidase family protein